MKKNLSKVLTLVLAFAMVLGLMTVGASAAFTDDADITYTDAVDLLTGLGVINGIPGADGNSFNPKGNFDRAGLAKMVAYYAWGGKDMSNYYAGAKVFNDLAGYEWAQGSINYGYNAGYINGVDSKSYDPDGTVTGSMLAKTLLVLLGYKADTTDVAYALVGGNWELNSIRIAETIGLYANLAEGFDPTKPLTREEAAQIFYNATFTNTVVAWNQDKSPAAGQPAGITAGEKYFGMDAAEVVYITENDATGIATPGGYTAGYKATLNADGTIDSFAAAATSYKFVTGEDMVGKVVNVYKDGTKVYAMIDAAKYVTVAGPNPIATAANLKAAFGVNLPAVAPEVATLSNAAAYSEVAKASFTQYDASANAALGTYVVYKNEVVGYAAPLASDVVVVTVAITDAENGYYKVGNAGDDDAYALKVATAASCYDKAATAINWLSYVKAGETSANVAFVVSQFGNKYSFKAPETVTGKVTKLGTKLTVDGVDYTMAADATAAAAIANSNTTFTISSGNLDFSSTFTFYKDELGKIFAYVKVTEGGAVDTNTYKPVYVVGTNEIAGAQNAYGATSYDFNIQYYTTDGAVAFTKYASFDGKTLVHTGATATQVNYAAKSGWYLLAETANGAALKTISATTGYEVVSVVLGSELNMTVNSTTFDTNLITKDSAFIYSTAASLAANNTNAAVVKGAHTSDIAAGTYSVVVAKNASNATMYNLVAAWIGADLEGSNDTTEVVYVVAYEGQVSAANVATGAPATYSYTVVTAAGVKESMVVTTDTGAGLAGTWKKLVKDAANGTVAFDTASVSTVAVSNPAKADYYIVDGVAYLNATGAKVVTNAVVVDLRTPNAANPVIGTTVDSILGKTVTATALYKTDVLTGANIVSVILVTA